MAFKDEVTKYVHDTFANSWTITDGRKIPTTDSNIGLGNQTTKIDAVVLYADLADSTGLVRDKKRLFATEVYKTFVYAAAKCIRFQGGEVTAYDGDRVMGVFMGDGKENSAVRAAFRIQGVIDDIIMPEMVKSWTAGYKVKHKVGIDASELWVANTGIRGNTDYVWVGNAANNAAKMSALGTSFSTYVTPVVYKKLATNLTQSAPGSPFFHNVTASAGLGYDVYGANAHIAP
jgi:class 3 adenylate cyclase